MQDLTDREKELLDLVREHPELLDPLIAAFSSHSKPASMHPAPQD